MISRVHREAILSLFDLVSKKLPALLMDENLIGAKERRSRLIRLEAKRLTENPPAGPVIAAGSTGTIPATRELLKAISDLENGAVVLPALDKGMDAKSWDAVSPQHPQFAIKQLIEAIGVEREEHHHAWNGFRRPGVARQRTHAPLRRFR